MDYSVIYFKIFYQEVPENMKIISKEDFQDFVNALIKDNSWIVVGVKSRGNKFAFATIRNS